MVKNSVNLLGSYGGDKRVCLSAWQSTTEELGIELPENIPDRVDVIFKHLAAQKKKTPFELLDFLAEHGHETPFEKAILDFQLTGEIASHIHVLKHRISSTNSESQRYKEFQADKFYVPDDWGHIECTKQIDYQIGAELKNIFEFACKGECWVDILERYAKLGFALYHNSINDLAPTLGRKRARESARYFLGYSTQLNFDWMVNFRSFVNIQKLRNSPHAQREIHQIANTMLYQVENIRDSNGQNPFEYCLEAFDLKSDPNYVLS